MHATTAIRRAYSRRATISSRLRRIPVLPLVFLTAIVVAAIFAPLLAPQDPAKINLTLMLRAPSWSGGYGLGTDHLGRDVLSRLIYGTRICLIVSLISVAWAAFVGTSLGLVSGYIGGKADALIMRVVDIMLGLPYMLIALVLVAIFGRSLLNVIIILVIASWAHYTRMIRGEVLSVKQRDFVALATVAGCSRARILLRHVFPNVVNTLVVLATLQVGGVILFEAGLSFLGMGVPPPAASWGLMTSEGRTYISSAWWLVTFPGIAVMLTVLSVNMLGDWLRGYLDPKLRQI